MPLVRSLTACLFLAIFASFSHAQIVYLPPLRTTYIVPNQPVVAASPPGYRTVCSGGVCYQVPVDVPMSTVPYFVDRPRFFRPRVYMPLTIYYVSP